MSTRFWNFDWSICCTIINCVLLYCLLNALSSFVQGRKHHGLSLDRYLISTKDGNSTYICPVAYSLILDIIRCSRWSQQQEALRIQTKYINHNYKLDRGTAVSVFVGNMEVVGSKQGKGERIMKINQE